MTHSWEGIVAAIIGLGVMILVHEWGHFIVARLCGVRVEVFSIGFGNRIFGWKRGDTDYRLAVFPFGGYVRMAGENPAEERTGAPYEFLAQPRWKRLLIILAGPFMNFVLAFVLTWGLFVVGAPVPAYTREPAVVAGVPAHSPIALAGVRPGDSIVRIDDTRVTTWGDALAAPSLIPGKEIALQLERAGKTFSVNLKIPDNLTDASTILGFPKERIFVDVVDSKLPAAKAGIKPGDEIISADGASVADFAALQSLIQGSPGKPVHLLVRRNGKDIPMTLTPVYTDPGDGGGTRWVVGYTHVTPTVRESYSFFEAGQQSWEKTVNLSGQILSFVGGLFSGRFSLRDAAGPVGIVKISVQAAKLGIAEFIIFMAFLSINLGILNLLPIPILDGGHVLMLAIEGSLRRDLSVAVKERFLTAGLIFLLAIIGYVTYFDVLRH
jgi:regulator of sigma E protease